MGDNYLNSVKQQFLYYKSLGEKAINQIPEEKLNWQYNEESNSIAIIVKHLTGNMLSRWTDFMNTDGEKEWRNRDEEFIGEIPTKLQLLDVWNKGWNCLFDALDQLQKKDLEKTIYIRNQGHTVIEAINRQLAHYPYHIGQIIFIGKMVSDSNWKSLSIPRGKSETYNAEKFSEEKKKQHFTEEFLKDQKSKDTN